MNIKAIFGHLKTVLTHKKWVFYYCCKLGIPWQGITHDLSKFSLVEFKESVRFYQGGKSSPIPVAKKEQGYSLAWQHHKGRNPHHYEYWTDNYDAGTTCIKMPWKYFLEMIADYLAAGRTYWGNHFTFKSEYLWWMKEVDNRKMNKATKDFVTEFLFQLKNAEKLGFDPINKNYLKVFKHRYESWDEQ